MNLSGLLSTLTLGTQAYKVSRMKKINSWLPHRKMICIGDSTQSDPEAYAEIYRLYPGWVRLILIRKVTDIAGDNVKEKTELSRFKKAFEGVPADAWHVFESPEECYKIIGDVVRRES
jgi:phosphatidate phosphatase APP1